MENNYIEDILLLFDQKNLIECIAWDYQLRDYFMVPITCMYLNGIGPCMYFINEYENRKNAARKLVHKYLAELDDDHIHMHVHFEIKGWTDPDSFCITSNNLEPCKKTIYLFDEIINQLKNVGQIPVSFNFRFDDSVGTGNYYRDKERNKN
jgi:hypothetical protein